MNLTRLFEIPEYALRTHPRADCLNTKKNGSWKSFSTQELVDTANRVSLSLLAMGIKQGDTIATISNNRPEWNFVDIGMLQIGVVHVPIYPTATTDDYLYILNHAEAKIVFVSNQEYYDKVKQIRGDVPSLREVFTFDTILGVKSFVDFLEFGRNKAVSDIKPFRDAVKADDLATLIYTSGTTGVPKGVMLSHSNICFNIRAVLGILEFLGTVKALSFLPLCHVYERIVVYLYLHKGIGIYYAESMETIAENIKEVKPTIFTTVPRLLEKVYDKIVAKGHTLTGIKKRLFFWSLELANRYQIGRRMGFWYDLQLILADKLVFSKWREALGGHIQAVVSGAAALQPRLATIFWAAGIRVVEGYGLSEASPVVSVNNLECGGMMPGTVGPLISGIHVKIQPEEGYQDGEGEILVKGPNVMMGYYKNPEATAETIDNDGWLHTGDIGTFVLNKYLKITDRKKEIFKTSGGKYIAPQAIENKFKESPFIEQIMVVGEHKNFPAALIVPSLPYLQDWCNKHNVLWTNNAAMIQHPDIVELFEKEKEHYNQFFGQWEKIKKITLLSKEWTTDSGELTPTLKLKRRVINSNYQDLIEAMYST